MIQSIINVIQENKPGFEITPTTELFESGLLDSFDLLILVTELENKFNISIPGEQLVPEHFATPESIFKLVSSI